MITNCKFYIYISTSKERSQILGHYKSIWRDYEAKYKSFPLAQTLLSLQAENKELEEKLKEEEEECGKLKEKLASFSGKWTLVFHLDFLLVCAIWTQWKQSWSCHIAKIRQKVIIKWYNYIFLFIESSCNELRNFNTFAVMMYPWSMKLYHDVVVQWQHIVHIVFHYRLPVHKKQPIANLIQMWYLYLTTNRAGKKLETCSVLKECWEITSDISKKEEELQKMQMVINCHDTYM